MHGIRVQEIQVASILPQQLMLSWYKTNSVFDSCDQSLVFCDCGKRGLRIGQQHRSSAGRKASKFICFLRSAMPEGSLIFRRLQSCS